MNLNVKIAVILLGVVILGLVIFLVKSDFLSGLFKSFPGMSNGRLFYVETSTSAYSGVTSGSHVAAGTVGQSSHPQSGTNAQSSASNNQASAIDPSQIPKGFTLSQLSPYFKKIMVTQAYAGSLYSYGQITLSSYGIASGTLVNITGWQIKTKQGGEYIPQAINWYDPSGLAAATDITLGYGQQVYIYSSSGPFNLRINKCIGYIGNTNKFTPSLPSTCPYVGSYNLPTNITGACENYIYSLGSCSSPNLSDSRIPQTDYTCRDYLSNHFNYKSCFEAHSGDADFLSNEWHIWMGSSPLDQYHDTLYLYDKQGLLVDAYSY